MKGKVGPRVSLNIPPSSTSLKNKDGGYCISFTEDLETQLNISGASKIELSRDSKLIISFSPSAAISIEAKESRRRRKEDSSSFYSYAHLHRSSDREIPDDLATLLDSLPKHDHLHDEFIEPPRKTRKRKGEEEKCGPPQDEEELPEIITPTTDAQSNLTACSTSDIYVPCTQCNLDCTRVIELMPNISQESLYNFFEAHGHFCRDKVCPNCGDPMRVKYGRFECRKQNSARSKKRQIICYSQPAFKDSWFDCGIDKAKRVILICYLYASGVPSTQLKDHVKARDGVEWYGACQNVVIDFFKRSSQRVGGTGLSVEMLITKAPEGGRSGFMWVIGGIEGESQRSFMVTVSHLSRKFLTQIMSSWINPGTKIHSDNLVPQVDALGHGFVLTPTLCAESLEGGDSSDNESISSFLVEENADRPESLIYAFFEKKLPNFDERFHEFMISAGVSYISS